MNFYVIRCTENIMTADNMNLKRRTFVEAYTTYGVCMEDV